MKKLFVLLSMVGLVFLLTAPLLAGGIDNKHNFSAEYIRTLNRNAATDSADAVVYNPAGVMRMENGFYLNFSGQYAAKDYSDTIGGIWTDFENRGLENYGEGECQGAQARQEERCRRGGAYPRLVQQHHCDHHRSAGQCGRVGLGRRVWVSRLP